MLSDSTRDGLEEAKRACSKFGTLFRYPNIVLKTEPNQVLRHLIFGPSVPVSAKNVIGPQIARLRVEKSMSQSEFAGLCQRAGWDVSRETLAKIESGIRCVTDIEVLEIAEALKVSVPSLFPVHKQGLFSGRNTKRST